MPHIGTDGTISYQTSDLSDITGATHAQLVEIVHKLNGGRELDRILDERAPLKDGKSDLSPPQRHEWCMAVRRRQEALTQRQIVRLLGLDLAALVIGWAAAEDLDRKRVVRQQAKKQDPEPAEVKELRRRLEVLGLQLSYTRDAISRQCIEAEMQRTQAQLSSTM